MMFGNAFCLKKLFVHSVVPRIQLHVLHTVVSTIYTSSQSLLSSQIKGIHSVPVHSCRLQTFRSAFWWIVDLKRGNLNGKLLWTIMVRHMKTTSYLMMLRILWQTVAHWVKQRETDSWAFCSPRDQEQGLFVNTVSFGGWYGNGHLPFLWVCLDTAVISSVARVKLCGNKGHICYNFNFDHSAQQQFSVAV